ncbi:MAG TPA: hypothetical protein VII50_08325, partial [Acidothermaceae bacterium]
MVFIRFPLKVRMPAVAPVHGWIGATLPPKVAVTIELPEPDPAWIEAAIPVDGLVVMTVHVVPDGQLVAAPATLNELLVAAVSPVAVAVSV